MQNHKTISNPDLTVGKNNKQSWNQAENRRSGFHNVHSKFRRALMIRSRNVLVLKPQSVYKFRFDADLEELLDNKAFSAMCCIKHDNIVVEESAEDFSTTEPHSIQSITKLHVHLIVGQLLRDGVLSLDARVVDYLPDIGSGYREARVQALLDMAVRNDFSEDYHDPNSDCYAEEIALGWRLPSDQNFREITLAEFTNNITGCKHQDYVPCAQYKSANTDVLTRIILTVSPKTLQQHIEDIADAVGYEGAFHISLSPEGLPALSGGGCLSARDLARFGLIFARAGQNIHGEPFANYKFLSESILREAPRLSEPKDWLKYSNHLMTDGRFVGHAGYGGQFLLVDTKGGASVSFLSVLENEDGYDDCYMGKLGLALKNLLLQL